MHVCRRWRRLVFGSPRCLGLQLYCTLETLARNTLDVWPALPLIIHGCFRYDYTTFTSGTDELTAALGQSNRICGVNLSDLADCQLEKVLALMEVPFPELTVLRLSAGGRPIIVPDSFLGGSATRLQYFDLYGIPFPGLPNLLSSATHLVHLNLTFIPHSGYISPEAIVALLSVLSSLRTLSLDFRSPKSRPDRESQSLLPPKHTLLPTLELLEFGGVPEYLEELVTCVDTPRLFKMDITLHNQIDFDCPQLVQFINRTPTLTRALDEAHVVFFYCTANLKFQSRKYGIADLRIKITSLEPDWQLFSIEQVCSSSLLPISSVEDLYIESHSSYKDWKNDATEGTLWLTVLLQFTAVKNLYISHQIAPAICAPALQELIGARITDVLPSLQNIFVGKFKFDQTGYRTFEENVGQFVAARQLSDHPVAISVWVDD